MRRLLRLFFAIVGLVAVLYGVASLTGRWLGTPPWWEVRTCSADMRQSDVDEKLGGEGRQPATFTLTHMVTSEPRRGREWMSGCLVVVGLALVAAYGAWPTRRRDSVT